ncbi:MAG: LamB/YcsF family protein [Pseudomarimonas sp.]
MQTSIDFNCDLGEGCGNDAAILPFISSASLACGFHAGDSATLRDAIAACVSAGVAIGAHPSFADREHFGRREHALAPRDVHALVVYQIGATAALANAAGTRLNHVKPHGALYNLAARDEACAQAIALAVRDCDPQLLLYGLADSALTRAGEKLGLNVVHEVFAERRYQANGQLVSRSQPDAVIADVEQSLQQVRCMLGEGIVIANDGVRLPIRAQSLCLHGDRADAVQFAAEVRALLEEMGVAVRSPQRSTR